MFLSHLSDACGRKPVFIFSVTLSGLSCAVLIATAMQTSWSIPVLAAMQVSGGDFLPIALIFAAAADHTRTVSLATRTRIFGIIEGCALLGMVTGKVMGGAIYEFVGQRYAVFLPFILFAILLALASNMRNSPADIDTNFSMERATPLGVLTFAMRCPLPLLAHALMRLSIASGSSVYDLVLQNDSGIERAPVLDLFVVTCVSAAIVTVVLLPFLIKRCSWKRIVLGSFVMVSVSWAAFCLVEATSEALPLVVLLSVFPLTFTLFRAILVDKFGDNMHGTAMGMLVLIGDELPSFVARTVATASWHLAGGQAGSGWTLHVAFLIPCLISIVGFFVSAAYKLASSDARQAKSLDQFSHQHRREFASENRLIW
eukprot:CAMPEP_0194539188 /NCGR_PEP_ID=MMETSP0253-20130528/79051_1 /TAXON_ID=2966 /ORGANISM="Noctiluca scintillans" /LENGTH=370 /DNA_ID=CAMNT_0039385425 /DNA_START=345 /DNA_END=1458 /DNA_ORIENTATION=+